MSKETYRHTNKDPFYFEVELEILLEKGWKAVSPITCGWGEYSVTVERDKQ